MDVDVGLLFLGFFIAGRVLDSEESSNSEFELGEGGLRKEADSESGNLGIDGDRG